MQAPTDRFWIRSGYKERDDAQVRLEESGEVFLCYSQYDRNKLVVVTLPWETFQEKFREFVDALVAGAKSQATSSES